MYAVTALIDHDICMIFCAKAALVLTKKDGQLMKCGRNTRSSRSAAQRLASKRLTRTIPRGPAGFCRRKNSLRLDGFQIIPRGSGPRRIEKKQVMISFQKVVTHTCQQSLRDRLEAFSTSASLRKLVPFCKAPCPKPPIGRKTFKWMCLSLPLGCIPTQFGCVPFNGPGRLHNKKQQGATQKTPNPLYPHNWGPLFSICWVYIDI